MREIKLRYVFKNKVFTDISIYYYTLKQIEEGVVNRILKSGMIGNEYEIIARDLHIGLKDKNGKEIFEGDIVEIRDKKCCITYENSTASYHLVFKGGTSYQYERYKLDHSIGTLEFFEVIGNIYENPELLERK